MDGARALFPGTRYLSRLCSRSRIGILPLPLPRTAAVDRRHLGWVLHFANLTSGSDAATNRACAPTHPGRLHFLLLSADLGAARHWHAHAEHSTSTHRAAWLVDRPPMRDTLFSAGKPKVECSIPASIASPRCPGSGVGDAETREASPTQDRAYARGDITRVTMACLVLTSHSHSSVEHPIADFVQRVKHTANQNGLSLPGSGAWLSASAAFCLLCAASKRLFSSGPDLSGHQPSHDAASAFRREALPPSARARSGFEWQTRKGSQFRRRVP